MGFHGATESEALQKQLNRTELSAAESIVLAEKMKALDRFFAKRISATYKIEVQFGKARSVHKPFPGVMSWYLSGTKLHGGGDEKLYLCPKPDCAAVIFPNERLGGSVLCRKCEMMWDEKTLTGELLFTLPHQKWAEVILKYFVKFEQKADIYLKYHPTDIRTQTAIEMERKKGGEIINKARSNRGLHIYPLANVIKDVSNGADLYSRFLAFLTA